MKDKLRGIVSRVQEESGYANAMITMTGNSEVLVEGNRGIIAYDQNCILLRAGQKQLRVEGSELLLQSMDGENLCIVGKITGIVWVS